MTITKMMITKIPMIVPISPLFMGCLLSGALLLLRRTRGQDPAIACLHCKLSRSISPARPDRRQGRRNTHDLPPRPQPLTCSSAAGASEGRWLRRAAPKSAAGSKYAQPDRRQNHRDGQNA